MTPAEQMLFSTVRLQGSRQGAEVGMGTGFFWRIKQGAHAGILLITNKHVIEGSEYVTASCHVEAEGRPSGRTTKVHVPVNEGRPINHPDMDVDLCALNFSPFIAEGMRMGTPLFFKALDERLVPSETLWESFDVIEEVVMVGCPRGIFDEVNNLPIARRGITATPLRNRYEGRDEFMVDMACFPGSSGSPVFLHKPAGVPEQRSEVFLGVLYAGPLFTQEGHIVMGHVPRVEVMGMMHLGQVIRSSAVLTLAAAVLNVTGPPPRGA